MAKQKLAEAKAAVLRAKTAEKEDSKQIEIEKPLVGKFQEKVVLLELDAMKAQKKAIELKLAAEKAKQKVELKIAEYRATVEETRAVKESEELKKKQEAQRKALTRFVNTKYDELILRDGTVLKSVKVTAATPSRVSLMSDRGVKNVKYSNLPEEIGVVCLYDEKLELIYINELAFAAQLKVEEEKEKERAAQLVSSKPKLKNVESKKTKEKRVKPVGHIRVKVVATKKYGRKTIEVIAKSNVDAYLLLNGGTRLTVNANQVYHRTYTTTSKEYTLELMSKKDKIIFAKEAWNKKSGLQ